MNEPEKTNELESVGPNPLDEVDEVENMPLEPVKKKPHKVLRMGVPIFVGGVVVILIGASLSRPTMGMPRSSQLIMEQRQEEAMQAMEAQAKTPSPLQESDHGSK